MSENIFIPEPLDEEEITPPKSKKKASSKPDSKPNSGEKKGDSKSRSLKFEMSPERKEKIRVLSGASLLIVSLYSLAACFSYFFTWKEDQDQILNVGFFRFMFSETSEPISNVLGKFGAWVSHFLMYELFGISIVSFCVAGVVLGIRILFKIELFSLRKLMKMNLSYFLWTSLFLSFLSGGVSFLGGKFGYYANDWLMTAFGGIGTFLFIALLFYVITTLIYNPNYTELFAKLTSNPLVQSTNSEQVRKEKVVPVTTSTGNAFIAEEDDLFIVNTLEDDDIMQDDVSETIDFSPKPEIHPESEIIDSYQPSNSLSDEFEIEIPEEEPTIEVSSSPHLPISDLKVSDEEDLAARLVREHGEYDPKKDLDGYLLPPVDLLNDYGGGSTLRIDKEELEGNKNRIIETLSHYKIEIAKIKATVGPTVTLYEIVPAPGVRIAKIKNLEDDIALSLSALGIRIIAPMPGKGTIGIEVPNSKPEMVSMRSLITSEKFQNFDGELPVVMGKTITNETFVFDLTKMPHLLVAGSTGQGKSVGLNAILISLLYRKHPAQVKFVLVDPKKVELTLYNKIERHFLAKLPGEEEAIITDTSKVVNTLNSLCIEMDARYELLKDSGVRTIIEYNQKFIQRRLNPEKGHRYLPYIVVLIDEFADLIMTAGKEVEHPIARIAQLARAIGIHLIVATQRPSVTVITGMIKANFPARIAFRVLSKIDSRTILDASGADQLIGRGDMLIMTGSDMKRLQCGFVDTPEVERICGFIGEQRAYPDALLLPEYTPEGSEGMDEMDMGDIDPMFVDSARIVVINQQGSASLLQRKLKLGYNRAGRIVDQLEATGIIGPFQGSKAREVLFSDVESLDEYMRVKGLL